MGFTYIKASGVIPYEKEDGDLKRIDDEIWYTADTFIPYLRLKAHIPLGSLFLEGFGGVAGAWLVVPQMNEGAVGRGFADHTGEAFDTYVYDDLDMDISFGIGFQAGGSIGMQFDAIRVQITGIYTDIRADTTAKSDTYYEVDYSGGSAVEGSDFEQEFISRLRGISVGIGGSYQM